MNRRLGIFCVSVDSQTDHANSIETARRRQELIELMERFDIPSNWTSYDQYPAGIPINGEATVAVPRSLPRPDLIQHLRQMNAALLHDGSIVRSVVVDPHEARTHWDVLTRQGCVVARPRTPNATNDAAAKMVRGGLWVAPLSCSFVGGSARSVRSLFGVCQRRLVESAMQGRMFHLNIDIGNARDSWAEERESLRALFATANEQRHKNQLRCTRLSDLPEALTNRSSKPMLSILKRAA